MEYGSAFGHGAYLGPDYTVTCGGRQRQASKTFVIAALS
jgi:nitric oxide reductase large subunit